MSIDRAGTLAALRRDPSVPVLILGGGINGAGVLRELALEGVDALLLERGDFASGATAASSRMIHGGLRYLEHGEFRLVREALAERERLLRNAPHCVHPLRTVIPLRSRLGGAGNAVRSFLGLAGRPAARGAWIVRTGLSLYDRFAGRASALPRHRMLSRREALAAHPRLDPAIVGAAEYFDAWNPAPERLCLEVVLDALAAHPGARALNHCAPTGRFVHASTIEVRDECTGEHLHVRPGIVVNATGAWVDRTNRRLGITSQLIGGTKGSHLVLDHPLLLRQTAGGEIFHENDDGRMCLILPMRERVLVGSTDLRIDDPSAASCDESEVDYLLGAVRAVFPSIVVSRRHIVSRFCGVRPLPRSDARQPGAISRDHACVTFRREAGRAFTVHALVGGKWTTFRAFAEQVCDRLLDELHRTRSASSRDLPIGGGRDFPPPGEATDRWCAEVAARTALPGPVVRELFGRHGTSAVAICERLSAAGPTATERVGGLFTGEIEHILRHEGVRRLDDLILRRTGLALYHRLDEATLATLARLAADVLGWSETVREAEVAATRALLRERHGVTVVSHG